VKGQRTSVMTSLYWVCTMSYMLAWTSLQGHLQNDITTSNSCPAFIITQPDYVTFNVDVHHNA